MEKEKIGTWDRINRQLCKHSRAIFIGMNLGCAGGLFVSYGDFLGGEPLIDKIAANPYFSEAGMRLGDFVGTSGTNAENLAFISVAIPSAIIGAVGLLALDEYAMPQVDRAAGYLADKYYPALRDWYNSLP